MKSPGVGAKRARELNGEPAPWPETAAISGFVNLGIGVADQPFKIAIQLAFGSKRRNFGEIGGGALIKSVESLQLFKRHLTRRIAGEPFECFLQRIPLRPFGFDESREVQNHECLITTDAEIGRAHV